MFADAINMSEKGGAFRMKLASLIKYKLVKTTKDEVELTNLSIDLLNAYSDEEAKKLLFIAFRNIPLFDEIVERFKNTGIKLDLLDRILIREYEVDQDKVSRIRKSITSSLEYIGVLNVETGGINISSVFDIPEVSGQKMDKIISRDIEITDEKLKEKEKEDLTEITPDESTREIGTSKSINSEIFELIVFFASHLDQIEASIEDISTIIENNKHLTHLKYPFEILKNKLEDKTITEEELEILLKALMQDLKIK